jgi:flagellar biosynthesis/type III secretory pathway M-ring protein FliF/YscJ
MEGILQVYFKALSWGDILTKGFRAVFVLLLAWIVFAVIMAALRRFEKQLLKKEQPENSGPSETSKRADTLTRLLRQGARTLVWTVAVLICLSELGVYIGPTCFPTEP